ncbi:MAG: enoyl-CoA hydratase/isomerase family protein [Acidimicrobiales bacterium]
MTQIDLGAVELMSLAGSVSAGASGELPFGAVVRVDIATTQTWNPPPADLAAWPVVVVGVSSRPKGQPDDPTEALATSWCDVVVGADDSVAQIAAQVERSPLASVALAQVLRGSERRSLADALLVESAVYSTLQAGPEFRAWLDGRGPRPTGDSSAGQAVAVSRVGEQLHVELSRPHVHNALDRQMRDELLEALSVAVADPSVERILLTGAGPSFCSGGDLDEFGSFPDPATAHLVRRSASVARVLAALNDRTEVRLHGACVGSGIELPAFARRIVAEPDTRIALPELRLGLIPGAGGTWSIPRRVGRHRTALLALAGTPIDAATALHWGLVDEIAD